MAAVSQLISKLNLESAIQFISSHRIAVATTTAVVLYGAWFLKRPKKLPPGPYGLPVIGSMLSVSASNLRRLKKKYGDVFCLWFGGDRYWVFLSSYDAIKEAYITRGDTFMDREPGSLTAALDIHDTILNAPYSESYKQSRKIGAQGFRNLIKSKLEPRMVAELDMLEEVFRQNHGRPMDLSKHYRRTYTNIILTLLLNIHYEHDAEELDSLIDDVTTWLADMEAFFIAEFLPNIIAELLLSKQKAVLKKETKKLISYLTNHVEHHISTYDEQNIRDMIDYYIKEGGLDKFGKEKLSATVLVFLPDGIHTASVMLLWCIIYVMNYPQYQESILQEVKQVVGSSRVSLNDRSKMPIAESFIMEVFRLHPTTVGMINKAKIDTTFRGYNIPSNVKIVANISAVLSDPMLFPEPNIFKPERFIKDGKINNIEGFIPFGVGRRMCMGEHLAKNEVFYLFTNLIMKYKIQSPGGVPPRMDPENESFVPIPRKFNVLLEPHKD